VETVIGLSVPSECFLDPELEAPLQSLSSDLLRGYIKASLSGHPRVEALGLNISISINEMIVLEPYRYLIGQVVCPTSLPSFFSSFSRDCLPFPTLIFSLLKANIRYFFPFFSP
jgi:hypothetical protein